MGSTVKVDFGSLEQRLNQRRETLRSEISADMRGSGKASYIEMAGQVHDSGDESIADLISSLNARELERESREVADIEAALDRIKQGVYGVCVDCDGVIDAGRLDAYPTAKRCVECQRIKDGVKQRPPTI